MNPREVEEALGMPPLSSLRLTGVERSALAWLDDHGAAYEPVFAAPADIARGCRRSPSELGLVLNALVLFNTRYMDAAVTQLRADGFDVRDEDVARLIPVRPPPRQHARPVLLSTSRPARRPAPAA